jgi:predicted metal-dependent peptidase
MITYDPNIAVIEDVSGSMQKEQLVTGRIEIITGMNQLGITDFWYLQADAQVSREPKKIRARNLYDMPATGRGGTDFRAAIEAVQKLRPRPSLVIYVTDGDSYGVPETPPPGMEFIWLIVPSPYQSKPCNWGRHIIMSDSREVRDQYEDDNE